MKRAAHQPDSPVQLSSPALSRRSRAWWLLATIWGLGMLVYSGLVFFPDSFSCQHFIALHLPIYGTVPFDDLLHFLSFFLLAVLVPLAFYSRVDIYLALVLLVLLAVATEFLQLFIPYRRFDLLDLAANLLGCLVGSLVGMVLRIIIR